MEPASLATDVVVIRRVVIVAPSIHYEKSDAGSNFDVISGNANKYLGQEKSTDKGSGKKIIVELLSIREAMVAYAPVLLKGKSIDVSLPDIELKDIGKDRGGVTGAQLAKTIADALKGRIVSSVDGTVKGVGDAAAKAARGVGDRIKGLLGK